MLCSCCFQGLWARLDGSTGVVQEIPEIRECEGPDAGLGPVLSRLPQDLQAAATGSKSYLHRYTKGYTLSETGLIHLTVTLRKVCVVTD